MNNTVVLIPTITFSQLQNHLTKTGWEVVSSASKPILEGEPEYAVFEKKPGIRLVYTFNPVCFFRVLDVPEKFILSEELGKFVVDEEGISNWLDSSDERDILRGILAVRQHPDTRYLERILALRKHKQQAIAGAAEEVARQMAASAVNREESAARSASLMSVEVLRDLVTPLLLALSHDTEGEMISTVRPQAGDYEKVFNEQVVQAARDAYESLWTAGVKMQYPSANQSQIRCWLAPAGMFQSENEMSFQFPGGYRGIAHLLEPHRIWVYWKCLEPGKSTGLSYDGLVWLEDRWVWFPKPYRVLRPHITRSCDR